VTVNGGSLTALLIDRIRAMPVTQADLDRAAWFVLDAAANAVAGRRTVAGECFAGWASRQGCDGGRRAFALGSLAHILETDDLHRASVTHPGCVVVPAVLAVGLREGSGALEMLTAVLHGYEAMCRVGMAVGRGHYRFWHSTATCGPFGSAMAAASLLGLDRDRTVHALGNAGTQSSGLWQFLDSGAMSKHLHAGRAAEAGVVAADLAALGCTGPAAILEGDRGLFAATCPDADPDAVVASGDGRWQLHETSIKPWPSCRHTHPAIDAALALRRQLNGREVVAAEAGVYQAAVDVCDRPDPDSDYQAKFSLQHCIAAALGDGRIGVDVFDDASRGRLAPVRGRVSVTVEEPYRSAYPQRWGARVSVTTVGGECLTETRDDCLGDPGQALADDAMQARALELMTYGGMGRDQARETCEALRAMADGRIDRHLIAGLFPACGSRADG
jgi:2-methylcitrate dehydratase PrpD